MAGATDFTAGASTRTLRAIVPLPVGDVQQTTAPAWSLDRGVGPCRRDPPASNADWGSTGGEPDAYGRREMYNGGTAGDGAGETDDSSDKG